MLGSVSLSWAPPILGRICENLQNPAPAKISPPCKKGTTMDQDFYYTVNVRLVRDNKVRVNRFADEDAALAAAALLTDVLNANGTLFDIDVYYIDIDHKSWLAGYCNEPEE